MISRSGAIRSPKLNSPPTSYSTKAHLSDTPSHQTTIKGRETDLNPSSASQSKTKIIILKGNRQDMEMNHIF